MPTIPRRFVALFDLHFGFERRGGHKVPLHDAKALASALAFVKDFKPQTIILGGDMLDFGAISHHTKHKPGQVEGLRVLADAQELRKILIEPLEALKPTEMAYLIGNHEAWGLDLQAEIPGLEGLLEVKNLLKLSSAWTVVDRGDYYNLGKLTFIHGDTLGGEHAAKTGVINYERNLRFGHFHTYASYTKNSPIDTKFPHTGISVPCLCGKGPSYGKGKPNRWSQGFLWGYMFPDGTFTDYVTVMVNGRFAANGKIYG